MEKDVARTPRPSAVLGRDRKKSISRLLRQECRQAAVGPTRQWRSDRMGVGMGFAMGIAIMPMMVAFTFMMTLIMMTLTMRLRMRRPRLRMRRLRRLWGEIWHG